jgi:hypothetical protein
MWVRVEEFPQYEVNEYGQIRRNGRILRDSDNGNGYRYIYFYCENKKYSRGVHRIVAQAFIPNPDDLPQVNHKDCDKANNHVSNLEWCNPSFNMLHAHSNGQHPKFRGGKAVQIHSDEIGYVCFGKKEIISLGFNYVSVHSAKQKGNRLFGKWEISNVAAQ